MSHAVLAGDRRDGRGGQLATAGAGGDGDAVRDGAGHGAQAGAQRHLPAHAARARDDVRARRRTRLDAAG